MLPWEIPGKVGEFDEDCREATLIHHSSNELGKCSRWLRHDDGIMNIIVFIITLPARVVIKPMSVLYAAC